MVECQEKVQLVPQRDGLVYSKSKQLVEEFDCGVKLANMDSSTCQLCSNQIALHAGRCVLYK